MPPLAGKLAVPVFDATRRTYDVYLVNADGTNLRRVVAAASAPALSADGGQLAYHHWQTDDRGLVVAASDGSGALRLTDKLEDTLPSFSPDGKKLVFSSYREGDRQSRLYYVWTDEANLRAWEWGAGGMFGVDPFWMSDGRIVYRSVWPPDELWVRDGDGANPRRLYAGLAALAPAASPDGRAVAFMSNVAGNWDIYVLDVASSQVRRLTDHPASDGLPAWSPDGQAIAFVSDRGGHWGLWAAGVNGAAEREIAVLPGSVDGRVEFEPDYLNHGWLEEQIAWSR